MRKPRSRHGRADESARRELAGAWAKRGVTQSEEFRELTNALFASTFGMTVADYRAHKRLAAGANLRDHMSAVELTMVALAETLAAQLVQRRDAMGFEELLAATRQAGQVAAEARAALEEAGVLLGVATGKSRRGLDAVLKVHSLTGRFVTLQTADVGPGKPNPHMVHRALAETGAEEAGTVVIGDTTYDIQMARNARVRSVGVSWGYHAVPELERAGADRIVHRGRDVATAVLELLEG